MVMRGREFRDEITPLKNTKKFGKAESSFVNLSNAVKLHPRCMMLTWTKLWSPTDRQAQCKPSEVKIRSIYHGILQRHLTNTLVARVAYHGGST